MHFFTRNYHSPTFLIFLHTYWFPTWMILFGLNKEMRIYQIKRFRVRTQEMVCTQKVFWYAHKEKCSPPNGTVKAPLSSRSGSRAAELIVTPMGNTFLCAYQEPRDWPGMSRNARLYKVFRHFGALFGTPVHTKKIPRSLRSGLWKCTLTLSPGCGRPVK